MRYNKQTVLWFALLPSTALAQEQSETIYTRISDKEQRVFESDHFKVTSLHSVGFGIYFAADYPIVIESKGDHDIAKVEMTVSLNDGLRINEIESTRGEISGSTAEGSTIVVSIVNDSYLEFRTLSAGGLYIENIKIYYDDTPGESYAGTTTPVRFNGLEWYIIDYSASEKTATLLSKECIGVSQFNPAYPDEHQAKYKDSIVESYLKQYYEDNFSAVDAAVISITPMFHEVLNDRDIPVGNEAKLWLLGAAEAYNLSPEIRKCADFEGGDGQFWWLRDIGMGAWQAYRMSCSDGTINDRGDVDKLHGVRPALKLDLSSVYFSDEEKAFKVKKVPVDVTEVTLNTSYVNLTVGRKETLKATVDPYHAWDRTVKWSVEESDAGTVKLYKDEACTTEVGTDATKTLTVYAKGLSTGSARITVTSNADSTKTAGCAVTVGEAMWNVTVILLGNMSRAAESGENSQTDLTGAMTDVVYTAHEGYYFPTDYSIDTVNGISVTRNSYTQITVSGTPTADVEIMLHSPTEKTKPDAPTTVAAVNCTTEDCNDGKLTGITDAMEYKKSDAESWVSGTGSDITGLVPGTYYVRVKETDTTSASDQRELTILGYPVPTYTVTYKVVGGTWSDDSTEDKTETVQSGANPAMVPTDMKAFADYTGGAWDTNPAEATITEAKTFTYTFDLKPAAVVTKAPEARSLTYDGQAKELVSAGSTEDGTLYYAVTTEKTAPADNLYDTLIPVATDAGTYYVWYKVVGDGNHKDSEPAGPVEVTIGKDKLDTPDFILPTEIVTIETEAFEGAAMRVAYIPDGCTAIGDYAFKDCVGLEQIRIPESVTEIGEDIFSGCKLLYVFGARGSAAEAYCAANSNCVFVKAD